MSNFEFSRLIAHALTNPLLQPNELRLLHTIHLRLLASGDEAEIDADERLLVMSIVSDLADCEAR